MKSAWEISANFVINTGTAVYNAAASAVTATIAAGQRILTLSLSKQITSDIQRIDPTLVKKTEDGQTIITGGGTKMVGLSQIVGLNGATLVSDLGCGILAAGGLN